MIRSLIEWLFWKEPVYLYAVVAYDQDLGNVMECKVFVHEKKASAEADSLGRIYGVKNVIFYSRRVIV
ncbi:MAG: hypothetical protein EOO39_00450 [Cytophagaceae bacterium]|nr:MAG: hypothetical protein EOO39_00450 [Cytophagaceae bacterium]